MNREDVKNRIINVIENEILMRELPQFDGDEPLGEDGVGIDSLSFLKLLTALEKEFDTKIDDEYWDYNYLKTLNLVIGYFMK